ncbi:DUF3313 domain-containing protein [Orrella sp. NBD-18]|uniref:DUF3313 domain-containing protein n=1 Tax=Sheuella amnicola TaxID=2707330 RepID=A0A6B2R361_9BURK|nr:DUF3313 domain-containing protein [Sheuella amnicola]NDY83819.1 DUF3313 domain-containing protein [Sheuella amnicola]HBI83694.1 DUF3313 domain-containing protein [Alcaligenaceae bacterium]
MKLIKSTSFYLLICSIGLIAGCASDQSSVLNSADITASNKMGMTHTGFLTDYARLKPTTWGEGIECWSAPNLKVRNYNKVVIPRIVVSIAPPKTKDAEQGSNQTIDPTDLKMLTDYFHDALVKNLNPVMKVVDKPGPGVAVLRVALTDLVPTTVAESVAGTLIPYAFIAEASSGTATGRPAGSTPYLGQTGMELQFRDGVTGAILAECRDAEIGRKYAADLDSGVLGAAKTWAGGYLNSFQSWSYAKNAFDKWSVLVAQRITQMRANETAQKK